MNIALTSDGFKLISSHILVYGKFPILSKRPISERIIIGNYSIKYSLSNSFSKSDFFSCNPTIKILPKMFVIISSLFEQSNTCSIHYTIALKPDDCLIEISEPIVNDEQTRFEYMINKGIDIVGIEFMSYEKFAERFFKELINEKRA